MKTRDFKSTVALHQLAERQLALRQLAVKRLAVREVAQDSEVVNADMHKKLHELQVNLIELELQNSELNDLREIREEIEAGVASSPELHDFAPMGHFVLGRDGTLRDVNPSGATLIGAERASLVGRPFISVVATEYRSLFVVFLERVFADRTKQTCELQMTWAGKPALFVHIDAIADEDGQRCFAVVSDAAMREIVDEVLITVSKNLDVMVRDRTAELTLANERLNHEISERIKAEAVLERTRASLRRLVAHQDMIKEEERTRIAREIHDDLGQNLLALRIDVSRLHARTAWTQPRLHGKVAEALGHIDQTIKSVRAIINDLRPNALDIGLIGAIEWQVAEYTRRGGVRCTLICDEQCAAIAIPNELALVFFRILQESLNNIVKHANATSVSVKLHFNAGRMVMEVSDNGIGFHIENHKFDSFGLLGIRERVAALDGTFAIESKPANGTLLTISIPIPN